MILCCATKCSHIRISLFNLLNSADISAYIPYHVNDDEYTRPARVAKHSQDELTRPPRSTG